MGWIGWACVALGVSVWLGPVRSQTAALESFQGTSALAGGESEMEDAIDRVIDRLNLFIREIARGESTVASTPSAACG